MAEHDLISLPLLYLHEYKYTKLKPFKIIGSVLLLSLLSLIIMSDEFQKASDTMPELKDAFYSLISTPFNVLRFHH